jgi:hypothetical protein
MTLQDYQEKNSWMKGEEIRALLEISEDKNKTINEISNYLDSLYQKELQRKEEIKKISEYKQAGKHKEEEIKEIKNQEQHIQSTLDASFYLELASSVKTKEELLEILPSKDSKNFTSIISFMMLYFIEQKTELMNLIAENYEESIRQEFDIEIKSLIEIIDTLKQLKIHSGKSLEEKTNKIVCLPKLNGDNVILDDIDSILKSGCPKTTLQAFKTLLVSIENGTFKGVKRFKNNQKLNGLAEVKDENARIIFKRLYNNTYTIICMFIKDCQKDKHYQEFLKTRADLYWFQEETLKTLELPNLDLKVYFKENEK